jgi:hypothetical protein
MADVIRVVEEGIAAVRNLEGGDPKMRLESFLSTFVSFNTSLLVGTQPIFSPYSTSPYRYQIVHWKCFSLQPNFTRLLISHGLITLIF